MKALKNIVLIALLTQGAFAFYEASEKKNQVIIREISLTTYSQLMGAK